MTDAAAGGKVLRSEVWFEAYKKTEFRDLRTGRLLCTMKPCWVIDEARQHGSV
jgi:hypothetical protein